MLVLEHTVPLLLVLLGVILAGVVGVVSLWHARVERRGRLGLLSLYVLLLVAMFWVLLQPGCRVFRTRAVKPRFIVLVDTSQSMQQSAPDAEDTRWDRALRSIRMPWVERVATEAEIDVYAFDAQLHGRNDLRGARTFSPTGTATRIQYSLQQLERLTVGQDVAGVLVLSDGHDTREASIAWASGEYRYPLLTVRLEDDVQRERVPDLAIEGVETLRRVTQGRHTEMRVILSGQETGGMPVAVQLFRDEVLVDEQPTQIPEDGGERELVFIVAHDAVGVFPYRLYIPPLPGEQIVTNNEYLLSITVLDAENRLLYLEGVPRFEYRFLRRVLLADEQILPAIFFGMSDGSIQSGSATDGLTADLSDEELLQLKVMVLGNLAADEITGERAARIVAFVEAGGSLVLLGGSRAWSAEGFLATALQQVAPIESVDGVALESAGAGFATTLTFAGQAHPVFSGDPAFWSVMPPVLSIFPHARVRRAAEILVTADTSQGEQPLVVAQRFGQGKVVAILTDSLWRWQLDPQTRHHPYARFWMQMVSWLLPDEDEADMNRIELFMGHEHLYPGESIVLSARVPEAVRRDTVRPMLQVTAPDGRTIPYSMIAGQILMPDGRGLPGYTYQYDPPASGSYRAVATYLTAEGEIESNPVIFHVRDHSPEAIAAPIRADALRALARSSGGRYFDDLESLNRALLNFNADTGQERLSDFHSLWQQWVVVVMLMSITSGIWFLRKRLQMP